MMTRYRCTVCGYIHGESPAGERWEDLPDDWTCPVCGAAKSAFQPVESDASGAANSADGVAVPASRAVLAHRVFGYAFLAIYVILMIQMVPRLWTYQIEFPARTVVHLSLGMAIGVVLLLKISVVRFFRRLDQSLVPSLGTFLLVGSVVLIGISVPAAFREAAATSGLLSEANRQRVGALLAQTGLEPKECTRLTTPESLREGQRILRQECIDCHDLRTVLAKPRTPENWRQTVRRMAERTTMMNPLEEDEQWAVTAYLVALSPDLQKSLQQLRDQQDRRSQSQEEAATMTMQEAEPNGYEPDRAKRLFDNKCTQCHGLDVVESSPPADETAARELVSRMVDEGLEATPAELTQIVLYLTATYGQASE